MFFFSFVKILTTQTNKKSHVKEIKPWFEKEINKINVFITILRENINIRYHQQQILTIKLLMHVIIHTQQVQMPIELYH